MQNQIQLPKEQISIKNNLWILWSLLGCSFVSFWYIGIKTKNNTWITCGITHFLVVFKLYPFLKNTTIFSMWGILCIVIYIISNIYLFWIISDFQELKADSHINSFLNSVSNNKDKYVNDSIQLWKNYFPDHYNDIDSKYNIIYGIFAATLPMIDGTIKKSEIDFFEIDLVKMLNLNEKQSDEFDIGAQSIFKNKVKYDDISILQVSLNDNDKNIQAIEMLILISGADGFIDKSEYNFIKMVSLNFGKIFPDFKKLAVEHNTNTSDVQKDENIKRMQQAGVNAGKAAILCVGVAAGTLLLLLNTGNAASKKSTSKSSPKTSISKKPSILSGSDKVMGKNVKLCGNCQYWTGTSRRIDRSQKSQLLIPYDEVNNGKCGNTKYNLFDHTMSASRTGCPNYELWSSLS